VLSAGLAGISYAATASFPIAISTLSIGFFIDGDHLFDYAYYLHKKRHERRQIKLGQFLSSSYSSETGKTFVFLHSYELIIPIWLLCLTFLTIPFAIWLTVGFLAHLISDQLFNHPAPLGYLLVYRIAKRFNSDYVWIRE